VLSFFIFPWRRAAVRRHSMYIVFFPYLVPTRFFEHVPRAIVVAAAAHSPVREVCQPFAWRESGGREVPTTTGSTVAHSLRHWFAMDVLMPRTWPRGFRVPSSGGGARPLGDPTLVSPVRRNGSDSRHDQHELQEDAAANVVWQRRAK